MLSSYLSIKTGEDQLFEDLLESVREAGAVLRGEQEAARRTALGEGDGPTGERRELPAAADVGDSEA